MPLLAIFPTAAECGDRVDTAHLEPGSDRGGEGGRDRGVEPAVAVKHRRVIPVSLEAFAIGQEDRDFRSVLARTEDLFGYEVVGLKCDLRLKEHVALPGF